MNENDIWNGYRLDESKEKTNDVYYMIAMQERNEGRWEKMQEGKK